MKINPGLPGLTWIAGMAIALAAAVTGCGPINPNDESSSGGGGSRNLVEGAPALEFYRQFAYSRDASGGEGYRYLSSEPQPLRAVDAEFAIRLFLLPDDQYVLTYVESKRGEAAPFFTSAYVGTWSVSGGALQIGGLGYAESQGRSEGSVPELRFTFQANLNSAGLRGATTTLRYLLNRASLEESRGDVLSTHALDWLQGEWSGQEEAIKKSRLKLSLSPRTLSLQLNRAETLANGPQIPCEFSISSSEFRVDGQPEGERIQYTLLFKVSEISGSFFNDGVCKDFIQAQRKKLSEHGLWFYLSFSKESETLIKVNGTQSFKKN